MKLLKLPHGVADYLCPINGLSDIYEWHTGERIPEQLLFYARSGFLLISNKNSVPPKMIMVSTSSIGKKQYEFWSRFMGYTIHSKEGKVFKNALKDVCELIEDNIPVIIFGLDMFHLEYQEKFYHKHHVPGHVVLMVGYDDSHIYVHDNSKEEIQRIALTDLASAWGKNYLNISRGNAYFGIDFRNQPRNSKEILNSAYIEMAGNFLDPPVSFVGKKGLKKVISEISTWNQNYDHQTMESIYQFFIMFTGSVLPKLPKELDESDLSGLDNPHKGTRDKFAESLIKYHIEFGKERWLNAAEHFKESGMIIEQIANGFVNDVLNGTYQKMGCYAPLFKQLLESEMKAYQEFI